VANPEISIVCPAYNEEEGIGLFLEKLIPVMEGLGRTYEIVFVNDGSRDHTLEVLRQEKKKYAHIRIINLSRNFGKEAALTAGLEYAKGDAVVAIDTDLQHPPEVITEFVQKWEEGYDVVVGKRLSRTGEHPLKKLAARLFYTLHNKISDIEIPADIGDFRLMSRRALRWLKEFEEVNLFLRGIIPLLGLKSDKVYYDRKERLAGERNDAP